MSENNKRTSRRNALKLAGAAVTGLGVAGIASANHTHVIVETDRPSDVTSSSATLHGDLQQIGSDSSYADVFFEWGESDSGLTNTTDPQRLSSPDTFSDSISGLKSDTFYSYRAVAVASDGERDEGDTESFNTDSDGML